MLSKYPRTHSANPTCTNRTLDHRQLPKLHLPLQVSISLVAQRNSLAITTLAPRRQKEESNGKPLGGIYYNFCCKVMISCVSEEGREGGSYHGTREARRKWGRVWGEETAGRVVLPPGIGWSGAYLASDPGIPCVRHPGGSFAAGVA